MGNESFFYIFSQRLRIVVITKSEKTMKQLIIFAITLILIAPVIDVAGASPPNPKKLKKAGDKYLSKGNFQSALDSYLEYSKKVSAEPEVNYKIGLCYLELERPASAQKFFRTVRSQNWRPYPTEFEFYQARTFHLLHFFDSAHHYYGRFLRRYNKDHIDNKKLQIISEEMVYPAVYGKSYEQNDNLISVKQAMEKLIASTEEGHKQKGHGRKVFVQQLGSNINSMHDEYAPCISSDGRLLLFASNMPKGNIEAKDDLKTEDLFFTQKDESDKFEKAARVNLANSAKRNFAPIAFDYQMNGFLLYESISETKGDIYYVSKKGDKWGIPSPLPEPINSEYWEPSAAFGSDREAIYFSSNRPGGKGGLDLYSSVKNSNGNWSTPINLGDEINTKFDEDAPYINPEGTYLYFSSRGHEGLGGYDIYRAKLEGGKILGVENLRLPINSAQDDIYFSWTGDGTKAYFSSSREGEGKTNSDIYLMDFSKSTLDVNVFAIDENDRRIRVRNFKACLYQMPEENLFACQEKRLKNQATFYIVPGKKYHLKVESEEYGHHIEEVMADQDFDLVSYITRNVILDKMVVEVDTTPVVPVVLIADPDPETPVAAKPKSTSKVKFKGAYFGVGQVLPVKVHFTFNEAENITDFSKSQLDMLFGLMEDHADLTIKMVAYTDLVGNETYNLDLSVKRAHTVRDYLVGKGLNESRIKYKGDGDHNPVVKTKEANLLNRRVEFEIVDL
jgi:outer membrane protein OmpA-like peptidoglycan-associated protein